MTKRLYTIWSGMKQRCNNPKSPAYHRYGGRGIKLCDEWKDFKAFEKWSLVNGYGEDLQIDRIDGDGNYEPSNCRWVTLRVNTRHRHPYLDEFAPYEDVRDFRMTPIEISTLRKEARMTQEQLAHRLGVSLRTVCHWEQGLRRPGGPAVLMLETIRDTLGKGKGK